MSSTTGLIFVASFAWLLQIILGFIQIKAFNRNLQEMSQLGKIKMGKTQSRFKPKTVIIVAEASDGSVLNAKIFNGLSVFSRPKSIHELNHLKFPFPAEITDKFSKSLMEAINVAYTDK